MAFNSLCAAPVPIQEAQQLATSFYKITDEKGRFVQLNIAQVVKTRYYTDGSIQQQDIPLYYVFNVNTHDGFVIIAAEDAALPILGYSTDGHFDPSFDAVNYRNWVENDKE